MFSRIFSSGDLVKSIVALTPLFQARARPPALPETYRLIADAWALSATPPKPEHLAVLDEGVRAFPRETTLALAAARLNASIGESSRAGAIAELGMRYASDADARGELQRFVAAAQK